MEMGKIHFLKPILNTEKLSWCQQIRKVFILYKINANNQHDKHQNKKGENDRKKNVHILITL